MLLRGQIENLCCCVAVVSTIYTYVYNRRLAGEIPDIKIAVAVQKLVVYHVARRNKSCNSGEFVSASIRFIHKLRFNR